MAKTSNNHSHTVFHIIILALLLISAFIFAKHFIRSEKWNTYVVQSQKKVEDIKALDSSADGSLIASTIVNVPDANPLIKQPKGLQEYIALIGKNTGRDIVVLDTSKKILADVVAINVGKKYEYDKNGEVLKTIGDGQPRTFVEESIDYPKTVSETVVPIKNADGATVGALIISASPIFNQ